VTHFFFIPRKLRTEVLLLLLRKMIPKLLMERNCLIFLMTQRRLKKIRKLKRRKLKRLDLFGDGIIYF